MRNIYLRVIGLFFTMFASLALFGQQTLTIYPDATGTSSFVPIPGNNSLARFMKSEFVIPASQLEAMEEGAISQMTFHLSKMASLNANLNFQVFLKEVNATSINSFYGPEGATIVYEGPLDGSQSTMDIAFTTNYTYHGGNLLVGVYQIANTYFIANIQFWGQTVSGASVQGNNQNSLGSVSATQRNFIPKTTFTYTPSSNTCPKPKNLAATNVANTSATLSWTQKGDADHWDVFYTDNPSYVPVNNTHPQFANIGTNPFALTGLPVGRTYYAYVRANCGNEVSEWSDPCVFTLAEQECTKPTNLVASGITTNAAILSWTAVGNGQNWEIQYKKADETNYIDVVGTITNPYTLQGLEHSHGYVVRVRAICGDDSYSDWLETTFFTDCNPITLPYVYGFEDVEGGDFPPCWSQYSTIDGYPEVFEDQYYYYNSHTSTHSLYFYGSGDEYTELAVLPQIPVDAQHPMSGNEIVFYAAGYHDPTSCQVGVMTDPNDPTTFVLVENIDIPNYYNGGIGFRRYRVSLSSYSGNGTYIAIRRTKVEGEDYANLFVDDIEVRPIPDCAEPTELAVTATASTTATLQWTANSGETSWHIQYKRAEDEWPDTYQNASQNPFTLEGLTPGTAYQARVRAVCSTTETSYWTDYASILTPFITPYYEDLESYLNNPSFLDKGWQYARSASIEEILTNAVNLEENPYSWQFGHYSFTDPSNGMLYFNNYTAHIYVNMADGADCLITPSIELGEGYQLSFDLGLEYNHSATSGLDDNRFAVLVTDDNGASWNLLALWDNDGTQGRTYYGLPEIPSGVNVILPNTYNNKTVRFAFCAESTVYNNGTNHLYVDNVNVTKCIRPDLIVASNITTNSATLDWTTHGESSWTLQYRLDGTDNWTTVSNITAHPYNLTGLVGPNYYQVRVKAHNAAGSSEWSTTALFATECATINLGPDETYEQHFESQSCPACWETVYYSGAGIWYFNYGFEYDEQGNLVNGACAYCNSGTASFELLMPEVEITPGLCVTFHHNKTIASKNRIRAYVTLSSTESFFLWDSDTDDLSAGVTTISLNDFVGYTATVKFAYNAEASGYFYIYDVKLHNMNTFSKQTANGYWNEIDNWSKGAIPAANESATVADTALIPTGYIAQANEVFITPKGSLTIADGGQLMHNNEGVVATVQKGITPYSIAQASGDQKTNGWYLIASPMQDAMQASETMLSNAFDLYRFNQSADLEWENYQQYFYLSPYFMLDNGQGYLYANDGGGANNAVTIELEGQLRPGGEELEIPLSYDASAQFVGWNLMGNPFAHNVTSYTATNMESGCFRMNATHDDLMVSEISAAEPLLPMEGFFVKATGTDASITFNASRRGETNHEGSLLVELSENGKAIDRLIVKGDEQKPLEKFSLNQHRSKIFATHNQREMAIVSREGDVQPVNFKAGHDGTFSLKVNTENMDVDYLHLIDNKTGNDVDLLQTPSYTFSAKTTDYASRFRLVFDAESHNDAMDDDFAFINNGEIIVTGEGTVQVVDVMGRILISTDETRTVSTTGMAPGIYVIRLIQGDNVKTQKIVIP